MLGGTAATTSTLVKRGPKDLTDNAGSAGDPPTKRLKVESGASNLDGEIKRSYEKGTVSKVRNALFKKPCYCATEHN